MKLEAEQVLCRIHLSNLARHGSEPLYEWIVETARHHEVHQGPAKTTTPRKAATAP